MQPLIYEKTTRLGVEVLTATFKGCDFRVRDGEEITVTLTDEQFTGRVLAFNIARVSSTEIQTTISISKSDDWDEERKRLRDCSAQGTIEQDASPQ